MSKPSLLISGLLVWIASAAWYLALISSYGVREYIAAALTASLAALATMVFARTAKVAFHLRWRDLLQAWRLPWCIISGTWEIMQGLAIQLFTSKGASSVIAAVPFDVGDRENLADAGRRALAITYTSGTPNFLILGIIDEQKWFFYHQIMPGDILTMTKNLGARP